MILYPQRELAVGASQTGKVMNSPWSCNCEGRSSNCRKPPLVEMSGCVNQLAHINLGGTAGESNPLVPTSWDGGIFC